MKRIVAYVGMAAVGAASVEAVRGQGIAAPAPDPAKPWSISTSLRGFYDDNVNGTATDKVHAYGWQVNPSVAFGTTLADQTQIAFNYAYSVIYYDHRPLNSTDKYDQTHTFTALLGHDFNERLHVDVSDSFVIGQEPDTLRVVPNQPLTTFQRISGNNIANYGAINFNIEVTPVFGLQAGYANQFYSYADNHSPAPGTVPIPGSFVFAPPTFDTSQAGLVDRIGSDIHLDGRWKLRPNTTGVVGYMFSYTDYNGNQQIGNLSTPVVVGNQVIGYVVGSPLYSDVRNNRSQYGYVGVDHNFLPNLTGAFRAGARYNDYYNTPDGETSVSPYVMANMHYTYTTESYAELGVTHDRNASDYFSVAPSGNNSSVTTDAESTVVYGSVRHRIVPSLFGSVLGTFQYSTYNGGTLNNEIDRFYEVGVNLQYFFDPHFSAEVGYNFDRLDSNIGNTYDRNRVYLGVAATF